MSTGCTITTHAGAREDEWMKPHVRVYYTEPPGGALGMSRIAWMTNKAGPVKPLSPSLCLSCCLAVDSASQSRSISACWILCLHSFQLPSFPHPACFFLLFALKWGKWKLLSHSIQIWRKKQCRSQVKCPPTLPLQRDGKHCPLFI